MGFLIYPLLGILHLLLHTSDMVGLCPGLSQGPYPEADQGRVLTVNFLKYFSLNIICVESFE